MGAYGQLETFDVKMCRLNYVFDRYVLSTCNFWCEDVQTELSLRWKHVANLQLLL